MLGAFAQVLHVKFDQPAKASIRVEVVQPESRADVVLTGSGWTVVIEAKVDAPEGAVSAPAPPPARHPDGRRRADHRGRPGVASPAPRPKNYLPFVGVRAASNAKGAAAGEAFLAAGSLQLREDYRCSGKGEPSWPAYFLLDPCDRWWEQLDDYRTVIVEQVTRGLNLMEAPLRAAVEELRR